MIVGKKFEHYRTLDSLQAYVLIAQDRAHIECYVRQQSGWLLTEANGLDDSLELSSVACMLALLDVYDQVTFDQQ